MGKNSYELSDNKVHPDADVNSCKSDPELAKQTINQNGDEHVPIDNTGLQKLLPKHLRMRYADKGLENLYQEYYRRQKRDSCVILCLLSLLSNVALLLTYALTSSIWINIIPVLIVIIVIDVVTLVLCKIKAFPSQIFIFISVVYYIIAESKISFLVAGEYVSGVPVSPGNLIGLHAAFVFLAYAVLPFRMLWCVVIGVCSCIYQLTISGALTSVQNHGIVSIGNEIGADLMLYICANVLGCMYHIFADKRHRTAFLLTKGSLAVSITIEEKSKEQERLLLSVLPKHVADDMIKDMGNQIGGQFRKIYMDRHENVSILFADIVGFTALSSGVTAPELVEILNKLFASFDELSKKYHQLRIKILGDCYYCISGAPVPRSDHAVLSIHMGLSVVEAIRTVRESTGVNVNMRVGIHTGAILGGVIGQKQWQFDVLGKDVSFANKMESGGVPGRVHISQSTANFLDGEFELEPGEGETREDAIKMSGIKTYLVKDVLKPYPEGTMDAMNGNGVPNGHTVEEEKTTTEAEDGQKAVDKRLYDALIERDDETKVGSKLNPLTLRFKDAELEGNYQENSVRLGMGSLCIVVCFSFFAQLCVLPKNWISFVTFGVAFVILLILTVISMAGRHMRRFPRGLVNLALKIQQTLWLRVVFVSIAIIVLAAGDIIDMAFCDTTATTLIQVNKTSLDHNSVYCEYPTFFADFAIIAILCATLLIEVTYLVKVVYIVIICALHCVFYTVVWPQLFDRYDDFLQSRVSIVGITSKYAMLGVLISMALAMTYSARYVERLHRKLYLCKHLADEQKDMIDVLREKNEALVYNILPSHVAKMFLGTTRDSSALYSQSLSEVGVIFAACPNFNDFYTEDSVNNNGLECLRFLNEIISDYDDLLNEPRFHSLIKIKTVGSTYMAASGINDAKEYPEGTPMKERWQHLEQLADFAFAMKDALDQLNQQSFNTFKLRIGINHGPIVCGVIGAKKPHFDIWGNTVNVSSRMDSTGKVGNIQVVEDTMYILKEFGFTFEKRGMVKVKGKGELLTYFLTGKEGRQEPDPGNSIAPF